MPKDAHGLEIPPPTRWKVESEKLSFQLYGEKKKHEVTAKKLRKADKRIELLEMQIRILKKQNALIRQGQHALPLEGVA